MSTLASGPNPYLEKTVCSRDELIAEIKFDGKDAVGDGDVVDRDRGTN